MKPPQPPCELAGHDIQVSIMDTSVPYLGVKCACQTCGATWLENFQRIFVGEPTSQVPAKPEPQLELI